MKNNTENILLDFKQWFLYLLTLRSKFEFSFVAPIHFLGK